MKFIIALFLFLPFIAKAQDLKPEDALQKFSETPQEKVYIRFDKADYLAGETMFFKAYIMTGYSLSPISTNLYIECLDSKKKVIYRNMLPIFGGVADGSFLIPKDLPEDIYYFRAYTRWMLNWDDKFNFIESINIYNPTSPTVLKQLPVSYEPSVHIEGGKLIDQQPANVAVRLNAKGRLPLKWNGFLFDKEDSLQQLHSFQNINDEFASFRFVPFAGKRYAISIADDEGKRSVIDLPSVENVGIGLQVVNVGSNILFNIINRSASLKGYKLLAQVQGDLLYSGVVNGERNEISGSIKLDSICVGIVHFSVFDTLGNSVCERLIFPNIELMQLEQPSYVARKTGDSVELVLQADSSFRKTGVMELINGISPTSDNDWNLLCAMYFGDLSKRPYKAAWYFDPASVDRARALDALMVSERWERFQWNSIIQSGERQLLYLPDNYLNYTATALRNNKVLANEDINIWIHDKQSAMNLFSVKTDSSGQFQLDGQFFYDTAKVYFQANSRKSWAQEIEIDFRQNVSFRKYLGQLPNSRYTVESRQPGDTVPAHVKAYQEQLDTLLNKKDKYKTLEAVVVKARKQDATEKLNEELSSGMFQSINETVIDLVNEKHTLSSSTNIMQWLQGRVAGLTVEFRGGQYIPVIRNAPARIYLDEMEIGADMLSAVSPADVAMIKVIRNSTLLRGSAVAIYTLRGGMKNQVDKTTMPNNTLAGYPSLTGFPVHWNSKLYSGEDNPRISIKQEDIEGSRLIITGFNDNGVPVYFYKKL